jgi:hypothetical protein
MAVDNNGTKWFASYMMGDLIKYDGSSWTTIPAPTNIGGTAHALATENNIKWIGYANGLARYDDITMTTYTTSTSGLINGYILDIFVDTAGTKWLATNGGGLQTFDGISTWNNYTTYNSGILSNFASVVIVKDHIKWVGTTNGLSKYNDTTWTNYTYMNSPLPSGTISALAADTNGDIWVGTGNGLAKLGTSGWTIYNSSNSGLPDFSISSILVDSNGTKWIGTNGGLVKYDGTNWTVYNINNSGLCHNYVNRIVNDIDGRKWISGANGISYGGGISYFDENGFPVTCSLSSQVSSTQVYCSSLDCNGTATITATGNGPFSYFWPSNGSALSSITNACSGTYPFLILDNNGCSLFDSVTIGVAPLPVLTTSASTDSICSGSSTLLTVSGAATYLWQPGNFTGPSVSVSPVASTTFTVTGTNVQGCTDTATVNITVHALPAVTANSANPMLCAGDSAILYGGGADLYSWSGGVLDSITFVPSSTSTYTVTGTEMQHGCVNTATLQLTVSPVPLVAANASATSVCAGEYITFTGSGANGYTWSNGIIDGIPFLVNTSGMYSVTGTSAGCTATDSIAILIHPLPLVSFTVAAIDTLCFATTSVQLNGGSPAGGIYSGPGVSGTDFNPNAAGVGSWWINYSYTDTNGCVNSAQGLIYVDVCTDAPGTIAQGMIVYPNPVSNLLTIENTSGNESVTVFNGLSEIVYATTCSSRETVIDMSAFAPGIYYMQIRSGTALRILKIVKE